MQESLGLQKSPNYHHPALCAVHSGLKIGNYVQAGGETDITPSMGVHLGILIRSLGISYLLMILLLRA